MVVLAAANAVAGLSGTFVVNGSPTKTAVVDGLWSTVGSYNLDHRSLVYNLELNVAILSREFGERLEGMFEEDRVRCQSIELETWKRRPALRKVLEWFFYLFRFWL